MTRFVDVYLASHIPGYPAFAAPRWSTEIAMADSGVEQVNQRWSHPLHRYTIPEGIRSMDTFNALRDHWLVMRGPMHTWPFRDPFDFASVPLQLPNKIPTVTAEDQTLGTGDGINKVFQLRKVYARGSQQYIRDITLPIVSTIRIWWSASGPNPAGEIFTGFTVNRTTGIVTFDVAPANGRLIKWGGLFDVPVRFESDDSFDGIVRAFSVGGFADITLLETRNC